MTRGIERTVRQTVIDRLIDYEPGVGDAPMTFNESVAALKASLLRDLDWLLNTRRIAEPAPANFREVQQSLYHYGIPDLTSMGGEKDVQERRLVRGMEEAIRLFEPRLTAVRVQAIETSDPNARQWRFSIEALLRMEPNPELVVFDTVLDAMSGTFSVSGRG
jgi:type VI secretion system protein ImpF